MAFVCDTINWEQMKAAGVRFCIARATAGTAEDVTYLEWISQLQAHDIPHGSYHFLHPKANPVIQAQIFVDTRQPGVIGDWLDVEDSAQGRPTWDMVRLFVTEYERLTGIDIGIYTNAGTWQGSIQWYDPAFAERHPLWVASWRGDKPVLPRPWTSARIWQYGGEVLPGHVRPIDTNRLMQDVIY